MLLVDDLAAGGTKNLRHTPRGLVTLDKKRSLSIILCLFRNKFNNFNHTGASMIYSIYHMTLRLL